MRRWQGCLAHLDHHIMRFAALAVVLAFGASAHAQSFTVLHEFTGSFDGATPMAGLTQDAAGNLYGTTEGGGVDHCAGGCGTVFKLSHRNGGWVLTTLYSFQGFLDGSYPIGRVIFGPDGTLYGTASATGQCDVCGIVFRLQPPPIPCGSLTCTWTETILHKFMHNGVDGYSPGGDLIFDRGGNIYGTTSEGGGGNLGTVYELTPMNGSWTETILHDFSGPDGRQPASGVVFDNAGNLYGTTPYGGSAGDGVVFELSPSGTGWTETVLHSFVNASMSPDGATPYAGLTPDGAGSFYGTTELGGTGECFGGPGIFGCGVVFHGAGSTVYSFLEPGLTPPGGPRSPVTLDANGNFYGTTYNEGANLYGNVYMLTAGQYVYTSLHDFTNGVDGSQPVGNVLRDSSGNLFGTTSQGGTHLRGVVWQIAP
jgi:uncharacterized repeat protein (TIGR03803 family)